MKTYIVPCIIAIVLLAGNVGCAHYPVPYARAHAPGKIYVPPTNVDKKPIVHGTIPKSLLKHFSLEG